MTKHNDALQFAYLQHRNNSKRRKDKLGNEIKFLLSFEEWVAVWVASGHLHERGKKKGQYVMSRKGDAGHYEIGNVFIQTTHQNLSSAQLNTGKKTFHTPKGTFTNTLDLRAAYPDVKWNTLYKRCCLGHYGFSFTKR